MKKKTLWRVPWFSCSCPDRCVRGTFETRKERRVQKAWRATESSGRTRQFPGHSIGTVDWRRLQMQNECRSGSPDSVGWSFSNRLESAANQINFQHNFCIKPIVLGEPQRDRSNRRLYEDGICIRHCQDSNSQSVQCVERVPIPLGHSDRQFIEWELIKLLQIDIHRIWKMGKSCR